MADLKHTSMRTLERVFGENEICESNNIESTDDKCPLCLSTNICEECQYCSNCHKYYNKNNELENESILYNKCDCYDCYGECLKHRCVLPNDDELINYMKNNNKKLCPCDIPNDINSYCCTDCCDNTDFKLDDLGYRVNEKGERINDKCDNTDYKYDDLGYRINEKGERIDDRCECYGTVLNNNKCKGWQTRSIVYESDSIYHTHDIKDGSTSINEKGERIEEVSMMKTLEDINEDEKDDRVGEPDGPVSISTIITELKKEIDKLDYNIEIERLEEISLMILDISDIANLISRKTDLNTRLTEYKSKKLTILLLDNIEKQIKKINNKINAIREIL